MKKNKILLLIAMFFYGATAAAQSSNRPTAPCLDCEPGGGGGAITCATGLRTLYVDASMPDNTGSGYTWATAKKSLKSALRIANACANIDSIRVAEGTYDPTGSSSTSDDRDGTFYVSRDYIIRGGYASGGSSTVDYVANPTYISGDVYHLFVIFNSSGTIIEGFNIRYANANGTGTISLDDAAGINMDRNDGGGMYMRNSTVTVRNCYFHSNQASSDGGAIHANNTILTLQSNVFAGNIAAFGAATYNTGTSLLTSSFYNCTFYQNWPGTGGGTVYANGNNTLNIRGCISWANVGAIPSWSGAGTKNISNCIIEGGTNTGNNSSLNPDFSSTDFDGPDNLLRTADDGLRPCRNSRAINRGYSTGFSTYDISGLARVSDGAVDIGAYEFTGVPLPQNGLLPGNGAVSSTFSPGLPEVSLPVGNCNIIGFIKGEGSFAISGNLTATIAIGSTNQTIGSLPVVSRSIQLEPAFSFAEYKLSFFLNPSEMQAYNARPDVSLHVPDALSFASRTEYVKIIKVTSAGVISYIDPVDADIFLTSSNHIRVSFSATGPGTYYVTSYHKFVFTGSGDWSTSANWAAGLKPPATLTNFSEVEIAAGSSCILNVPQVLNAGSKLTVQPGATLQVNGNLTHQ